MKTVTLHYQKTDGTRETAEIDAETRSPHPHNPLPSKKVGITPLKQIKAAH